ncbi:MAG: hypothetical protein O3B24_08340 [Verrucomicrobia bacterium]|nr:hypothetical protein [Verrucomicrobiota bacterium]
MNGFAVILQIAVLGGCLIFAGHASAAAPPPVRIPSASSTEGYLARLLINEVTFPGERGFRSETDSLAAMDQLLFVLIGRLDRIPAPYTQKQIAATTADNMIDIITAGGVHGQFEGFYRDGKGLATTVPRVEARVTRLTEIANQGEPGRFARLIQYACSLATGFVNHDIGQQDRFAALQAVEGESVTGGAYGWMTDDHGYRPGGNFVRIPDSQSGTFGGNRFFALRKEPR